MASPVNTPPANPFHDPFDDIAVTDSPKETKGSDNVSAEASRPQSAGGRAREKKRVGFTGANDGTTSSADRSRRESWNAARTLSPGTYSPPPVSPPASGQSTPSTSANHSREVSGDDRLPRSNSKSHLPELSQQQSQQIHEALMPTLDLPKPRPAIRRTGSTSSAKSVDIEAEIDDGETNREAAYRRLRAQEAFQRGKRLEYDERLQSEPSSRGASPERPIRPRNLSLQNGNDDILLQDLGSQRHEHDADSDGENLPQLDRSRKKHTSEAHKLVRKHTQRLGVASLHQEQSSHQGGKSGVTTPTEDQAFMEEYRPRPEQYRGGILGALLKLYNQSEEESKKHHKRRASNDTSWSGTPTPQHSPPMSGISTPVGGPSHRRWYSPKHNTQSTSSLAHLVGSSASLSTPAVGLGEQVQQRFDEQKKRPTIGQRSKSAGAGAKAALNRLSRPKLEDEIRITVHIAETISRQKYLMKLCKALMQYGAPTHRLEEYMVMSARVLEIDAQFLYIPGSMIMSFDDPSTHTTEVKLVKVAQGLDLGKLRDVHEVYKDVVHDRIGVEEATSRIKETAQRKKKHSRWLVIPVYGLASVCVGPFAFGANLMDLPILFILGSILGILQHIVAPRSDLYANVFEIGAAVITSFLARAFGSIPYQGDRLFCFSALAQASIALILPGYTVLCASLELQSKSIVAGSVRMVYAIIYSLFLGFGITIGTAIYGIIDPHATSATTCQAPMEEYWFFFFVPGFTMCLIIINQAKWKQAPTMMIIAFAGYVTNYFSSRRFAGNTQVSNTLGALVIGVLANLYSRIGARIENKLLDLWEDRLRHIVKRIRRYRDRASKTTPYKSMEEGVSSPPGTSGNDAASTHVPRKRRVGYGLAAAAMLPAIFVQVPSGLAVSGSLVSGIASADQITGNATNGTTVVNQTQLGMPGGGASDLNSVAFNVGFSVIQVAIGITVGLFLSAIVVYPFGKKRSGLFSF
ncbi:hypothetical protein MBLNU230_g6995t1 [Neophaeotheca triangularis]